MIRGCEEKKNCCGCTACMHICPVEAIEMKEDEEGFFYPSVDQGKCIGCGKCVAVCPFLVDKKDQINIKQQYYAVKHKNNEIIEKSSSGGCLLQYRMSYYREPASYMGRLLQKVM